MLRNILRLFLLVAVAVTGSFCSCTKPLPTAPSNVNFTVDLTKSANSGLAKNNGSMIINQIIIAHTSGSNYYALFECCTHENCNIEFVAPPTTLFQCPCCGSLFDLTGNVDQGPATIAIVNYKCVLAGSILTVSSQ